MESVEKATGAIPQPMPLQTEKPSAAEEEGPARAAEAEPPREEAEAPSQEKVWTDVLTAGAALFDKLAQALTGSGGPRQQSGGISLPGDVVARDEKTGQAYLKLPLPEPETMQKIAEVFAAFTKRS
jgi:hypothetical protein